MHGGGGGGLHGQMYTVCTGGGGGGGLHGQMETATQIVQLSRIAMKPAMAALITVFRLRVYYKLIFHCLVPNIGRFLKPRG